MLDIKFIRENPEKIKAAAKAKNLPINLERILELDKLSNQLQKEFEDLRHQQKQIKTKPAKKELAQLKKLAKKLKQQEEKHKKITQELEQLLLLVPNIPSPEAPIGKDETANQVIKIWGNPIRFNFEPKSHTELAKSLDIIDFERGVKIGGFRSYFLKNEGVLLDLAIHRYALDFMLARGFNLMIPPVIAEEKYFYGTGFMPWFKEEIYRISEAKKKLALIGTSEIPLISYHAGEILFESELPKRYAGFSPCFRTEIGSYGKDTKGLYRLHQFNKVEQVVFCRNNLQESQRWLEEIQKNAEDFIESLGLPYRVMEMCTGEMGAAKIRQFDLETWMPSYNHYRETHSASNLGDFQARRLGIRYRDKKGKIQYVHTLNNTLIATPRILIPLLENCQHKDGSVTIPKVLQKYTGFANINPKKK